jgi:hypothetical protein
MEEVVAGLRDTSRREGSTGGVVVSYMCLGSQYTFVLKIRSDLNLKPGRKSLFVPLKCSAKLFI